MDIKFVTKGKKGKTDDSVSVPASVLDEVINILSNVDCTCVWSQPDNQYIKINDVPQELVDDLKLIRRVNDFANGNLSTKK